MNLNSDSIVLYPTDTVWGIGCSIYSRENVEKIHSIKGYEELRPMSVLFSSIEHLREFVDLKKFSDEWLVKFFKMESSLAVSRELLKKPVPEYVTPGSDLVSVRCLSNPQLKELIERMGAPITTTSLNEKGQDPACTLGEAKAFQERHKGVEIYQADLEPSGASSTIVSLDENFGLKILREGRFAKELKDHVRLLSA